MSSDVITDIFALGQWMINDELKIVNEIITSYVRCNANLALLDFGNVIIVRNHLEMNKPKILSGGASGHEPAFAGFVGKGMLTAAVQGEIFQSPSPDVIFKTLKQLLRRNPHGVLIIINNRLSDRLAFGLAVERIKSFDNVQVKIIIVDDEIKFANEKKGLTGTIVVQKIAGGMVEKGFFLDEIYNFCTQVLKNIVTINVIIKKPEPLNVKVSTTIKFINEKEMEFGGGFHGEPGFFKSPIKSTSEITKIMLKHLFCTENEFTLETVQSVVVIINNLGTSRKLEERIFLLEVLKQLEQHGIKILRVFCATLMTSLNAMGFSLTLIRISDEKVLEYLDYPTDVTSWTPYFFGELDPDLELNLDTSFPKEELIEKRKRGPNVGKDMADVFSLIVKFVAEALNSCERILNLMDSERGDSDTGTNMKQAAVALTKYLTCKNLNNPFEFLKELSTILEEHTCSLCGLLYSIMLSAAAKVFSHLPESNKVDAFVWLKSLEKAVEAVKHYGKVDICDHTLLNPLADAATAISNTLQNSNEDICGLDSRLFAFQEGVEAAERSAMNTKHIEYADPGAHAVAIIFRAIFEAVKLKEPSETTIGEAHVQF